MLLHFSISNDNSERKEDHGLFEEALHLVKAKIDDDTVNYFNINCSDVLDGTVCALKRTSFKDKGRISVKFADDTGQLEGAIDASGPTREFLGLVIQCVTNSSIFGGCNNEKYLTKCNTGTGLLSSMCKV